MDSSSAARWEMESSLPDAYRSIGLTTVARWANASPIRKKMVNESFISAVVMFNYQES
jgi:hypothetical protein